MKTNALKLIAEPHILFTGRDGSITSGITVRHVRKMARGYREEFDINDHDFLGNPTEMKERLSLSEDEYQDMAEVLRVLTIPQP
jgi:uncharacterized cupredoxin-like copper-binding protein